MLVLQPDRRDYAGDPDLDGREMLRYSGGPERNGVWVGGVALRD
jgi:hypothetical protein